MNTPAFSSATPEVKAALEQETRWSWPQREMRAKLDRDARALLSERFNTLVAWPCSLSVVAGATARVLASCDRQEKKVEAGWNRWDTDRR
jgi:hypothetical protein